ncbi:MAG: hypothetical protein QXR53_03855 [Candidatus Norongarragalinales archaeon]
MRWSIAHSVSGMEQHVVKIIRNESEKGPVVVHEISFRRASLNWPPKRREMPWSEAKEDLLHKETVHAKTPEEAAEKFVQILNENVFGITKDTSDYYRDLLKEMIKD